MPDISIVIPVYNAEHYIQDTLQSILEQSFDFRRIQVIVVDDGSTDGSIRAVDAFCRRLGNVELCALPGPPAGPSRGRNRGLDRAIGDFVMFLDADDQLLPHACETLYNRAIQDEADVVAAAYVEFSGTTDAREPTRHRAIRGLDLRAASVRSDIKTLLAPPVLWCRIFRRRFIESHQLRFPELRVGQDVVFTFQTTLIAERMSYVDSPVVRYRKREDSDAPSVSQHVTGQKLTHLAQARMMVLDLFQNAGLFEEYLSLIYPRELRMFTGTLLATAEISKSEIQNALRIAHRFFSCTDLIDADLVTPIERTVALLAGNKRYDEASEAITLGNMLRT